MDCLGGFVLTELYGMDRSTGDLDAVEIVPDPAAKILTDLGREGGALHHRCKLYLQRVGVASLPENYEERMVEAFPGYFRHLRLMVLEAHDLALSKLSRNLQRDRDDVRYLARVVPLSLDTLRSRYFDELRLYLTGSDRWNDQTLELWLEMLREDQAASASTGL